jgi:hypothetical protein
MNLNCGPIRVLVLSVLAIEVICNPILLDYANNKGPKGHLPGQMHGTKGKQFFVLQVLLSRRHGLPVF